MDIGKKLRTIRLERNMTLEQVGKVVGVSRQTIQRYEIGEIQAIPYDKVLLLAKALNCSPVEFFFDGNSDSEMKSKTGALVVDINHSPYRPYIEKYMALSNENKEIINLMIDKLSDK